MNKQVDNGYTKVNLLRNGKVSTMTVNEFLNSKGYIIDQGEPFWLNSTYYKGSKLFIGDMNGRLVFVGPYLAGDGIEIDSNPNSRNIGEIRLKYPLPVLAGNAGKVLTVNETADGIEWAYTGVEHGTKEYWASKPDYRPEAGKLVIYDDFYTDGNGVKYAGLKIGTGNACIGDLPFMVDEKNKYQTLNEFYNHINNHAIHVSPEDRQRWDNKINIEQHEEHEIVDEMLVFNRN